MSTIRERETAVKLIMDAVCAIERAQTSVAVRSCQPRNGNLLVAAKAHLCCAIDELVHGIERGRKRKERP